LRQQTVVLADRYKAGSYHLNNLKNIKAPSVVLHGAADPLVALAHARGFA